MLREDAGGRRAGVADGRLDPRSDDSRIPGLVPVWHAGPVTQVARVGPADGDRHEWHRAGRGWHLAFAGLAATAGVLLVVQDDPAGWRRYGGLAGLVVLCCWYAIVAPRVLHRGRGRRLAVLYVAVALPLTIGLFALVPVGALMLCMLYPHIWALLPIRSAVATTVGAAVATAAALLAWMPPAALPLAVAISLGSVVAASVIGLWIHRIIGQSRRRSALITELATTRSELAEVSRTAGVLAERQRLARDIHDTLSQGFTSIVLLLQAIEMELGTDHDAARRHLAQARQTAHENLAEARAFIADLAPPDLQDASLPAALRHLVERIGPQLGIASSLTVSGDPRPLSTDEQVVLVRATQEALSNVGKHAAASRVTVELVYRAGTVSLRVTDDGRGFDPAAPSGGFGLPGMRDRVAKAGGRVRVDTAPGSGTTVHVEL